MSIFVLSFRNSISFFASLMDRSPWSSRLFRSILPLELHFIFSLSFIFLSDFLVSFFSCSSYLCLSYFWVLDESLPVGFVFHLSFPLSAFLPINCLLSSENFLVSSRDVSFSYKCLPEGGTKKTEGDKKNKLFLFVAFCAVFLVAFLLFFLSPSLVFFVAFLSPTLLCVHACI